MGIITDKVQIHELLNEIASEKSSEKKPSPKFEGVLTMCYMPLHDSLIEESMANLKELLLLYLHYV